MLIQALGNLLKACRNNLRFAYLNFENHPRGREMLEALIHNKQRPTIVVEEISDLGSATTLEQSNLLSQLPNYQPAKSVKQICSQYETPYYTVNNINDTTCIQLIKEIAINLIVLGDTRIIKNDLLSESQLGIINIHPGILPDVRGNNPYIWSVLEGTPQGVTAHFIDEGIDTGPILLKTRLFETPKDYPSLIKHLNTLCANAIVEVLNNLKKGTFQITVQPDNCINARTKASNDKKTEASQILVETWKKRKTKEPAETFSTHESSVRAYCRTFSALFVKAEGSYVFDSSSRAYIDFLSAAGSVNYGHNDPDILSAIIRHLENKEIIQSLDLHTAAKLNFINTFADFILTPRNLKYKFLFPGPTGTNAVEAAFKLARKSTGRKNIISFSGAFHGMSMGALAATTNRKKRQGAGVSLNDVTLLPYENSLQDDVDCAAIVEQMILNSSFGIDPPAAFILETIQGEGGLSCASTHWLQRIAALAKKVGALLIIDDIQCGCGRSGKFFSFEGTGITPDIILLSKSLSGFGTPLSLVLVKKEHDVLSPGEHNGTFRGNNLGFVGATKAIEKFWSDTGLEQSVREKSVQIFNGVTRLINIYGADNLRYVGRGLICGIRFTNPSVPALISKSLFARGFIIETCGANNEVLKILPPLTIDADLIQLFFDEITICIAEAFEQVGQLLPPQEKRQHEPRKARLIKQPR